MTRRNTIHTVHEPCGDAYYYGPERMGSRFEGEEHEQDREKSGFSQSTFKSIFDRIESESTEVCSDPQFPILHSSPLLYLALSSLTQAALGPSLAAPSSLGADCARG